jgi:putative acetyltransferase
MSIAIRAERQGEAAAVRAVNDAAFGKTTESAIVDAIRGTDRWIAGGSLVAVDETGGVVGHALLSEGDLDLADGTTRRIWMLGPVAVHPGRQRQGIGGMLVRAAAQLAMEHGQPVVCLLGHATYYPRFGFQRARSIGIEPPRPWPDEAWMVLRLPGWTPEVRGVARFPPGFPDSQ